jgi:hypothetical protein
MYRAIAIALLLFLAGRAEAQAAERFTLYSDICYNYESGDIGGVRFGVLRLTDANYVFLQWAEGVLTEPHIVMLDPADLKNGKLVFSTPVQDKHVTFQGRITDTTVTGTLSYGTAEKIHLRKISLSQKGFAPCQPVRH